MDEPALRALIARRSRDRVTLARLREALGLDRAELGALLGVTEEALAGWERGDGAPDETTWSLLEQLVRDHLALREKVRDPGEWIGTPRDTADDP